MAPSFKVHSTPSWPRSGRRHERGALSLAPLALHRRRGRWIECWRTAIRRFHGRPDSPQRAGGEVGLRVDQAEGRPKVDIRGSRIAPHRIDNSGPELFRPCIRRSRRPWWRRRRNSVPRDTSCGLASGKPPRTHPREPRTSRRRAVFQACIPGTRLRNSPRRAEGRAVHAVLQSSPAHCRLLPRSDIDRRPARATVRSAQAPARPWAAMRPRSSRVRRPSTAEPRASRTPSSSLVEPNLPPTDRNLSTDLRQLRRAGRRLGVEGPGSEAVGEASAACSRRRCEKLL